MSSACIAAPQKAIYEEGAPTMDHEPLWGGSDSGSFEELPICSQLKVMSIRQQIQQGTYDLDRRLDIILDRVICESGRFL